MYNRIGSVQVGPVRFRLERVLNADEARGLAEAVLAYGSRSAIPFSDQGELEDGLLPYVGHVRRALAAITSTELEQQELWRAQQLGSVEPPQSQALRPSDPRFRFGGQRRYLAALFLATRQHDVVALPGLGVRLAPEAGTLACWNLQDVNGRTIREAGPVALASLEGAPWQLLTWVRELAVAQDPSEAPTKLIPPPSFQS